MQPAAIPTAASPSKTSPAPQVAPSGSNESFAIVHADRQGYDQQLHRFVATGHVQLQFNGWILLANRVEVADRSRSFYATGQVQLHKGDQYLQASSMRYSSWEASGELLDVYGVIEQDTFKADTAVDPKTPQPKAAELSSGSKSPAFVCPPVQSTSCPSSQPGERPKRLLEALQQVTFKPELVGESAANNRPIASHNANISKSEGIDQHVRNVQYQRSFNAGIKINFSGLAGYTTPSSQGGGSGAQTLEKPKGQISHIRFQSSNLLISKHVWKAHQMAFTNDPFTPARSWTIARNVTAALAPDGSTKIWARNGNIILENKLFLPVILSTTLNQEKSSITFDVDNQDRDGFYVGYNIKPILIGPGGVLNLQPQLLVQRASSGESSSFVAPGSGLESPNITQPLTAADAFGLLANLNLPLNRFSLNSYVSLATLDPDHLASGTRSINTLSTPLKLPLLGDSSMGIFGNYRQRSYNGSLGQQNLIYAYGAEIGGSRVIQTQRSAPIALRQPTDLAFANPAIATPELVKQDWPKPAAASPFFQPIQWSWHLQSGSYQASLYNSQALATLWRTNLTASASSAFVLWNGQPLPSLNNPAAGLRYSASAITPGLSLAFGTSGTASNYGDGSNQNLMTFWGGPSITLGHFEKPFFDYTRLSASVSGTFVGSLSPFGFDRSVDNRTVSFSASQQIYGPLVLEGGATYNIDPNSIYYGNNSYSYFEVKWQRRSYEFGVYYSPYDGIGGVRIKLNDFNFDGTGIPFVPTAHDSSTPIRRTAS